MAARPKRFCGIKLMVIRLRQKEGQGHIGGGGRLTEIGESILSSVVTRGWIGPLRKTLEDLIAALRNGRFFLMIVRSRGDFNFNLYPEAKLLEPLFSTSQQFCFVGDSIADSPPSTTTS